MMLFENQKFSFLHGRHRNNQIAGVLCVAETNVNFHVKNVVDKLQANDRTHAVTLAVRRGLLTM